MGKGGYNGGSSLLNFSWFGWGSGSTKSSKQAKPIVSKKTKKLLAEQKSAKQRKHEERQAEEQRLAKIRRAEKATGERKNAQPKVRASHGDPDLIAKRLSRHMIGVEVRRITKNTLRVRKAEAVSEQESAVSPPTRGRLRPAASGQR